MVTDAAGLDISERTTPFQASHSVWTRQYFGLKGAVKVHGHQPPSNHDCNYLPQNVCPNLLKASVG